MISSTTFKGAELTAAATRAFCPICTTSYPLGTTVCAQDGTELVLADELTGVTVGGGFVVGGLVRSDGLSTMYEAAHPNVPGARFALLAVHAQHAEAGALWMRFKSKELALRALKHARAAHVRELGRTEDGRPFVVGVFPDGTPLSELLGDSTKVDARGVTRLGRQLAQAVAAAHRKAIVHHDLRPENVYVTGSLDEPRVTVFGFGLSVFKEASLKGTEETGSHTTVYVAPEQAEGTVGDHRADVYSIGAILFRALTGQEPSHALGNEVEATLRKLAPEAPATLVSALARTMALSPSGRFAFLEKFDAAIAPMDAEADEELFDQMFDVLDASAEAPPVSSGPTAGPERIRVVPRASGAGAPPKPVVPRPPVPEVREAALASAEALTPPPPSIGAAGRVGALSRAFGLTPAAPRVSLRPAPAVPGEKGPGAADQHPGARHADAPAEREATRTPSEPPQAA